MRPNIEEIEARAGKLEELSDYDCKFSFSVPPDLRSDVAALIAYIRELEKRGPF